MEGKGAFVMEMLPQLQLRVEQVMRKCRDGGVRSIALFGAGSHTEAMLPMIARARGPAVTRILVTRASSASSLHGIPIVCLDEFDPASVDAVVLSSHTYEPEMFYASKQRFFDLPVYPVWNSEQDFELYDKLKRLLGAVARKCTVDGIGSVAVFGAGSHTRLLLPMWNSWKGPQVRAIVVSDAPKEREFMGIPVVEARSFDPSTVDAVLLSSRSFEREMFRSCVRKWPHLPVYPVWDGYEEPLVNRLRRRISGVVHRCAVHNVRSIALYGAGLHTRMLVPQWRQAHGPEIAGIIVSSSPAERECLGIPVVTASEFDPGSVDAIVLSSTTYENEMRRNCRRLWPDMEVFSVWTSDTVQGGAPDAAGTLAEKTPYEKWHYRNRLTAKMRERLKSGIAALVRTPKFSFVMPVYNTPGDFLGQALESIRGQIYENWEACVVDDGSTVEGVGETLRKHAQSDGRIRVRRLEKNLGIVGATNEAIRMAGGDYLIPVDHDDLLEPDALAQIAKYVDLHPDTDVLYTDNDRISDENRLIGPDFKPAWSPELMSSWCYTYHVKVFSRRIVDEIGLMDPEYECAQDYEFFLRAVEHARHVGHIPLVLYHHRILKGQSSNTRASQDNGRKAVESSVRRRGVDWVRVEQPGFARATGNGLYRLSPAGQGKEPVAVVLHAECDASQAAGCLESLVRHAEGRSFDVVVASPSGFGEREKAMLQAIHGHVEFVHGADSGTRTWGNLANRAAGATAAEYLVFVDGRNAVATPGWLERLLLYARIPEVGVVGGRVLDAKGRILHAGLIADFQNGVLGYACRHLGKEDSGYMHFARVARNCAAVTHDCMAIRKSVFDTLRGFESTMDGELADVDLCLRSHGMGLRTVCAPEVEVARPAGRGGATVPFESKLAFRRRWPELVDPYYNVNFKRSGDWAFEVAPEKNHRLSQFGANGARLKVLSVSHNLNYEGAPHVKLKIDLFLADQGALVDVISAEDGPLRTEYEDRGIEVRILDCPPDASFTQYEAFRDRLRDRIRDGGYDAVYVNTLMMYWAVDAAHAAGVPSLWNVHESIDYRDFYEVHIPDPSVRGAALSAIGKANRLAFVCRATAGMFAPYDRFGVSEIVYNGIDAARLTPADAAEKRALRARLGLPERGKLVAIVGTVCPRKGQLDFVRCAAELIRAGSGDSFAVVGVREASYLADYLRQVRDVAAEYPDRIALVPETPAHDYLRACDVFVCASYEESFPMVILEAMSCGLPIVTTPVYGIAEQVSDGNTALFFRPGDVSGMAGCVARVTNDPDFARELGKNARAAVEVEFGEARMTARYHEIVAEVAAEDVNAFEWLQKDTKVAGAPAQDPSAGTTPRPAKTDLRSTMAARFISGEGLEIGALHNPIGVPPSAKVRYVDRMSVEGLRRQYPELAGSELVPVDVVDDGEKLATVQDESQDFVIANHFLEHCQNPILALENFMRVLRTGGVVLLAVPDKRFTFDVKRQVTPFEHLLRDYREGPGWSRHAHFEEWVREVYDVRDPEAIEKRTRELLELDYSIHYHVWTQADALEMIGKLMPRLGFDVEYISRQGNEVLFVLRKAECPSAEAAERATA